MIPISVAVICLGLALLAIKLLVFSTDPQFLRAALALGALATVVYFVYSVFRRPQWACRDNLVTHALNVILLFSGSCAFVHVLKLLTQRFVSTPWEEIIYMSVVHFPHISDIYSMENLTRPPIYVSIYSPAYYAIYQGAVWWVGKSLIVGRWLSAAGLLLTACLLAFVLRRNNEGRFRFMPPLIFLSVVPTLCFTGSFAKPEFLAVGFSLAGLLVYVEFDQRGGSRWIVAAALLCTLAFLIKPTVLAGAAAIIVHLLWTRRFSSLLMFLSTMGAIILPINVFLSLRTGGGFWVMTIVGNNARLLPRKILQYAFDVFLASPIVIIGIAAAATLLARASRDDQRRNVLLIFFFVAFGWFFYTVGRPGSSYTYFLEGAVACSIVTALILSELAASKERQFFYFVSVCLILALTVNLWQLIIRTHDSYDEQGERAHIVRLLSNLQTDPSDFILADPHYAYLAVVAGHHILVNDSLQYTLMADNRVVSVEPVMKVIQSGRVPFLVLVRGLEEHSELGYGGRYWPREVVDYLKRHYGCESVFKRGFGDRVIICSPH